MVADLTGVRVDAGAVLTFAGLRRITDAVDGVEVCLPKEVRSWHTRRTFPAAISGSTELPSSTCCGNGGTCPTARSTGTVTPSAMSAGLIRAVSAKDVLSNPVRLAALLSAPGKGLAVDDDGLPLTKLVAVLPELDSVDPVGLSLPVGEPVDDRTLLPLDPKLGRAFLDALREDRLAQWVEQHPERVNRVR